jgi:hypothetical protein
MEMTLSWLRGTPLPSGETFRPGKTPSNSHGQS